MTLFNIWHYLVILIFTIILVLGIRISLKQEKKKMVLPMLFSATLVSITLAILFDLNSRELPIRADVVGEQLSLKSNQRVKLSGPTPLAVSVIETH